MWSPVSYTPWTAYASMPPHAPRSAYGQWASQQYAYIPAPWQSYFPARTTWLPNRPLMKPAAVTKVTTKPAAPPFKNRLKELFFNREAVTYALHIRTFGARDKNGDMIIDPNKNESGTFLKAIQGLPELKAMGINNIHLLPILPVGKKERLGDFGSPGSVYAPEAYDSLNEEYKEPNSPYTLVQEARMFVDAAHKLGIHVMVDIPSCASVDLAETRPDLLARDAQGNTLTPTNWVDIRMFVKDSPALRDYYQKFFDLMINDVGVDGFRADVARARTMDFWRYFIGKYPDKAWLAETYTEEDASPMKNIPRDVPEDLMKAGFDSIYGQFHIFHDMDAHQYIEYLQQHQALFNRIGPQKSLIGSFLTHDDPSTMKHGGALYCKLISGLMATQPHANPYILDGFTTGYTHEFDIFNWRQRPTGQHPDIGEFLTKMLAIRQSKTYGPVLTRGQFIPLEVSQNKKDPSIIAFLRQHQGKTLLVVANKNMNSIAKGTIEVPGLNPRQKLFNLAPSYGGTSTFVVNSGTIETTMAPGRFYLFDLTMPQL